MSKIKIVGRSHSSVSYMIKSEDTHNLSLFVYVSQWIERGKERGEMKVAKEGSEQGKSQFYQPCVLSSFQRMLSSLPSCLDP